MCYCILQGYVRFEEEQGAHKVVEGMTADGAKPELCGAETKLKVLEGETLAKTRRVPPTCTLSLSPSFLYVHTMQKNVGT